MYVELVCSCEASFSIDSDGDANETVWALTWRFANAHVECGFISPSKPAEEDNEIYKKRGLKAKKLVEEEEDEND